MRSFSHNSILKIRFIQNSIIIPPVQNAKEFIVQALWEGFLVEKKVKNVKNFWDIICKNTRHLGMV